MGYLILLIYGLPAIAMVVGAVAMAVEFVLNTIAVRQPQIEQPPAMLIPRRVDLRERERVDAWLFRHGLTNHP